jgi:hypothetical protein
MWLTIESEKTKKRLRDAGSKGTPFRNWVISEVVDLELRSSYFFYGKLRCRSITFIKNPRLILIYF